VGEEIVRLLNLIELEAMRHQGRVSTRPDTMAPMSRAPAVAYRPMGHWANTATVSPMRMAPLSALEKPVDMMSDSERYARARQSSWGLLLPRWTTKAMTLHLAEIAQAMRPGRMRYCGSTKRSDTS
jgi:hypothetical protein